MDIIILLGVCLHTQNEINDNNTITQLGQCMEKLGFCTMGTEIWGCWMALVWISVGQQLASSVAIETARVWRRVCVLCTEGAGGITPTIDVWPSATAEFAVPQGLMCWWSREGIIASWGGGPASTFSWAKFTGIGACAALAEVQKYVRWTHIFRCSIIAEMILLLQGEK